MAEKKVTPDEIKSSDEECVILINKMRLMSLPKQLSKQLANLGILTVQDLLFHLPLKYQDRTHITFIRNLKPGKVIVIEGIITHVWHIKKGRTKLLCTLQDETGKVFLRFFHVLSFQKAALKLGSHLRCFGEMRIGANGLEMIHPEYQLLTKEKYIPLESHLTPVYPATMGLSQNRLRKLILHTLQQYKNSHILKEILPQNCCKISDFPSYSQALDFVHKPPPDIAKNLLDEKKTPAHRKLIFEELLAHRVSLLSVKKESQKQPALSLKDTGFINQFLQTLPFRLTFAQQRVLTEIEQDLIRPKPMLRLLQGDVGSGKTIIALLAMLFAVQNGYQAALMAPTELLAFQHFQVFRRLLDENIAVNFLASSLKARDKKIILKSLQEGKAQIIIGTHALFQEKVRFNNLAMVVIDEQHRFGVLQRALLRQKGLFEQQYPHQLVMTATPIPRTLAMSCYADLDSSIIDELPPGRSTIITRIVPNSRRKEVIERIKKACREGRQIYWVCPFIEESEIVNCQAAVKIASELKVLLREFSIGLLHGRLTAPERESVMQAFKNNQTQVLVATTIIEVGVDVPNASLMIIENAERLGLAQLHQLRGRVGRGSTQSHCLLLYQAPLTTQAKARLAVMRETTDGFKIAQRDLELRGPGEVLGTKQTGSLTFRIADLIRDKEILPSIYQAAETIMSQYQDIIPDLIERWIGTAKEYRNS